VACGEKENAQDASRVGLARLAAIGPKQDYIGFESRRKLNQLRCSPGVQSKPVPDDDFALLHACLLGVSNSLAM
jgi:hypothetical protein